MKTLTNEDFSQAASVLGCEVAAIKAVCEVEAPRGGFLLTGEPVILFERHLFSRLTNHRFDDQHADISSKTPGGYKGGQAEHVRLQKAAALDRDAALSATSWGRFQILGLNYKQAGFESLRDFINGMYSGEPAHLMAFVMFIRNNPGLVKVLRTKDFTTFARIYNGPGYAKNAYDTKMAAAYRRLK